MVNRRLTRLELCFCSSQKQRLTRTDSTSLENAMIPAEGVHCRSDGDGSFQSFSSWKVARKGWAG